MNKNVIAAAILAVGTGAAHSQTNVSIYGIVDGGFVHESGGVAGSIGKITSGVGSTSRIGFRGTEDLGGGTSVFFTLENGHRIDTGEVDAAGTIFNRQAFVGIKTRGGSLSFGRQYTPWHQALTQIGDPFGTGYAGGSKNLFPDYGTNVRTSNTIVYTMPVVKGISGDFAYSLGEQIGSSKAGRQIGASLGYAAGALNVRFAYNRKNADIAAAPGVAPLARGNGSNKLLVANYDFNTFKAHFALSIDKGFGSAPLGNNGNPFGGTVPTASTDGNELLLGATIKAGPGNIVATVMRKDDRTARNQDARSAGIGYLYLLSKRTTVYTVYGVVDNENGAGYTVANNSEAGSGDRAFNLGIRHTF